MGEVANSAKQPAGDAWGPPRAPRDLAPAVLGEVDAKQPRGAADDQFELLDRVEIEPHRDAEAVAQRRGEQALAGGRPDQGEARQLDPDRAGRRPLADHQVERAVLHRRVEHLLDRRSEAVDLVDEQDVAVLEVGEQRREIAGLGDYRARSGAEADAHLARQDPGERGLAESRRAVEQDMVERLAAALRGVDEDAEVLARRLLADELGEALRPKRRVRVLGRPLGRRDPGGVGCHLPLIRRSSARRQAANGERRMLLDRRTMMTGAAATLAAGPALARKPAA